MDYDALIAELGKNIGLEGLAFDSDGSCSVVFDDKDEIFFEKNSGKMLIIAPLGPAAGRENLFRSVLEANFLGGQAAFGSIGINADQDEFTLARVLEGDERYEEFEKSLLIFIQCLRKWKRIILDGKLPQEGAPVNPVGMYA